MRYKEQTVVLIDDKRASASFATSGTTTGANVMFSHGCSDRSALFVDYDRKVLVNKTYVSTVANSDVDPGSEVAVCRNNTRCALSNEIRLV